MKIINLLPFLSALNGINMKLAGLNIRMDQLIIVFLMIILFLSNILGKIKLYLDKTGRLLLLFFIWSFAISFLLSPNHKYSLVETINLLSSASVYFVLTNLLRSKKNINKYFKSFLWAGILSTSYGIIIFVLSIIGLKIYGVNLNENGSMAYGVFATMREPNIFGSFSLIYFILSLVIILSLPKEKRKYNKLVVYLIFSSGLGLFLSFTRGVWLAAIVGVIITLGTNKEISNYIRKKGTSIFLLAIFVFFILIIGNILISNSIIRYKISHLFDYSGGTGAGRIDIWENAFKSFLESPWFGRGTYSYAAIYSPELVGSGGQESVAWIGNLFLTLLHDTGIIGMVIFLGMTFVLLKEGIKSAKWFMDVSPMNAAISYGFCISLVCLIIAFIFTTGFSYVYAWSVLGFIGVYNRNRKLLEREHIMTAVSI
jgi:O-antigen ligase